MGMDASFCKREQEKRQNSGQNVHDRKKYVQNVQKGQKNVHIVNELNVFGCQERLFK